MYLKALVSCGITVQLICAFFRIGKTDFLMLRLSCPRQVLHFSNQPLSSNFNDFVTHLKKYLLEHILLLRLWIELSLHNDCNNIGQVCNPNEHPIAGWYMLRFFRGRLVFKIPTHLH